MTPPSKDEPVKKLTFVETFKMGIGLLKNRNCFLAILLCFGFIWAEMGIATFLTLHLTREVGLDLATAAIISGASGLTGWIGQIVWGHFSDIKGRKVCLGIIIIGWIIASIACNFIVSVATGWIILIAWGLFRNSPFPVIYAVLIDSAPHAAASGMGLMIGLAVGSAGFLVAPIAGWIISHYGFSAHYIVITAALVLTCIPLFRVLGS